MNKPQIPNAAYVAAETAHDAADPDTTLRAGWLEAVDAAAPIIVATALSRVIAELSAERDREIDFAMKIAVKLDSMETKPSAGDQRYMILSDAKSRADGLRIAIQIVSTRAHELTDDLDPPPGVTL